MRSAAPGALAEGFRLLALRNSDTQVVNPEASRVGGFLSDASGSRPIRDATCEIRLEDDGRSATSFRYEFTLPDGEVVHVWTGRKHAQSVNGLMR